MVSKIVSLIHHLTMNNSLVSSEMMRSWVWGVFNIRLLERMAHLFYYDIQRVNIELWAYSTFSPSSCQMMRSVSLKRVRIPLIRKKGSLLHYDIQGVNTERWAYSTFSQCITKLLSDQMMRYVSLICYSHKKERLSYYITTVSLLHLLTTTSQFYPLRWWGIWVRVLFVSIDKLND